MLPYDSPDSMPHVAEPPTTPLPVPSIRSTAGTRLRPALAVLALADTFGAGVGVGRIDLAGPGATGASPDGWPGPCDSQRRAWTRRGRLNPSPTRPSPSSTSVPGSGTQVLNPVTRPELS